MEHSTNYKNKVNTPTHNCEELSFKVDDGDPGENTNTFALIKSSDVGAQI